MKRNRCKDVTDGLNQAYATSQMLNAYDDVSIDALKETPLTKKFMFKIMNKYAQVGEITEQELEQEADKYFGDKTEAKKISLITRIGAALQRRPDVQEIYYEKIWELTTGIAGSLPETVDKYIYTRLESGTPVVNLSKLPANVVTTFGVVLQRDFLTLPVDGDIKINRGWFGNLQLEHTLPRNIAYKTTNPALRNFNEKVTYSNMDREATEKEYTSKSPNAVFDKYEINPKTNAPYKYNRRDYGITDLYQQVLKSQYGTFGKDYFGSEQGYMEFIHMFMMNRIQVDSDGKVYLKTNYGKKMEGGRVARYPDGNPIYDWFDREPLVMVNKRVVNFDKNKKGIKFTLDKKNKKVWSFENNNSQLQFNTKPTRGKQTDFDKMMDLVQGIQYNLWHFGKKTATRANNQSEQFQALKKEGLTALTEGERKIFSDMLTTFESEIFGIHGLDKFQVQDTKKFYFPKKLTSAGRTKHMSEAERALTQIIIDNESKITRIESIIDTGDTEAIKENKITPRSILDLQNDSLKAVRSRQLIREKIDIIRNGSTQTDGTQSQNPIFLQNYIKNFKSVTNMIPWEAYRLDEFVVRDYISETSRALERREMSIALLKLMIEAKGKPIMQKYGINAFKRMYQHPDAVGRIFGISVTDNDLNKLFSKFIPGFNKKDHDINAYLKDISSFYTFNLLSGPTDGLVNLFSLLQEIQSSGYNVFNNAITQYNNKTQYWENLAERAGVISFSKYLEGYVDEALRDEDYDQADILKAQLNQFVKQLNKVPASKLSKNDKRNFAIFKRDIDILNKSVPNKFKRLMTNLAHYAITHKFQTSDYANPTFKSKLKKAVSSKLFPYVTLPSIADTEKMLRTISFIIGFENAGKMLGNVGEKTKIELARKYVYQTQFGLESYLVGESLGSTPTKFLQGITTFRKQKFGFSRDTHKYWGYSYWDPEKLLKDKGAMYKKKNPYAVIKQTEAFIKAFLNLVRFSPLPTESALRKKRAFRQLAPFIKKGESFFWLHGLGTAFAHFFLFSNPALSVSLSALKRHLFKSGTYKATIGTIDPMYMGILATGSLATALYKNYDDDDKNDSTFYDYYRFLRSVYGTGFMDLFSLGYMGASSLKRFITGEEKPKSTYHTDPSRHIIFQNGMTGYGVDAVKFGAEKAGDLMQPKLSEIAY